MIILGINAYHADSSAAIFVDGKLIVAAEEERFKRIKHWAGFPEEAVKFCLDECKIKLDDVDFITIGRDPKAKLFNKLAFVIKNIFKSNQLLKDRIRNKNKIDNISLDLSRFSGIDVSIIKDKLCFIEHHLAHSASAFFASPFEESAILSIDGSGDFTTTMLAIGKKNKIEVIDSLDFPVSAGLFYSAFTQYLGFPNYGDEYKVMGLAPYGKPIYVDEISSILKFDPKNGLFDWDKDYFMDPNLIRVDIDNNLPVVSRIFSDKFEELFGPARLSNEELSQKHKDIAASVQKVCENLIIKILNHLQKRTGQKNICIAGGVAQNSVANGKIIENTSFENLYIPSAGHDAGISMGSALFQYYNQLNNNRSEPIYSAYTGSRFTNDEIEIFLKSRGIKYEKLEDERLFDVVTEMIISPGVIGWFSGRAEFGPRALGARSILADPRNGSAKELLNEKIKRRESFRPFAPSILEEYVSEYFTKNEPVPFMEKVFPIRPEKYSIIPAVTHIDGTGRLQTVNKDINYRYYNLIEAFRKKTGVPILLNTSFNENEPIVNTPAEALDCFLRTKMDMLVLENCVIVRQ
jgi:carbamoyltransferase